MDLTILPGKLKGTLNAIPSKSQAHRLLICAAFSNADTILHCPATNQDIEATADCLRALGAAIEYTDGSYMVSPIKHIPSNAVLHCGESGSTLRFMLPIAGALGVDATFIMQGRLPQRPLSPMWEEMERNGCILSRPTDDTIRCQGKLNSGKYTIDGGVSSQFVTGLLFAMALLPGSSTLTITGKIESKPYIEMTLQALELFGVSTANYQISGSYPFVTPKVLTVEGDWSNGAFFLTAKALGSDLDVRGLTPESAQGDRAVAQILDMLNSHVTVDAADIPDLVPILAVAGGAKNGISFTNVGRLRLKESDRVETVAAMLRNLGAEVQTEQDCLTVFPAQYRACTINAAGDHRIAMASAIAATIADGPVTILGAQCVAKSYPAFWDEYARLGGKYEQYVR